jgi:hypothetical protein
LTALSLLLQQIQTQLDLLRVSYPITNSLLKGIDGSI